MPGPAKSQDERSDAGEPFAGAVNLMAHPLAGAAALTAVGFAFASQAFGLWAGAIAGAAEAQRRLMEGVARDAAPSPADLGPAEPAGRPHLSLVSSRELPLRDGETTTPRRRTGARKAPEALAKKGEIAETPAAPAGDDLKAIAGIGPKLERVLNGLGISTYAQVASLTGAEIERLDAELGIAGRIERDGWIDQARRLGGQAG